MALTPEESKEIAQQVVAEFRQSESSFFVPRALHHKHHEWTARQIADQENQAARERFVDGLMEQASKKERDSRDVRKHMKGGAALAVVILVINWLAEYIGAFIDWLFNAFPSGPPGGS